LGKENSSHNLPLGRLNFFDCHMIMGVCWMATKFFQLPKKAWEVMAWNGNNNNGKWRKRK
jgi:hypothetical protein